MAIFTEKIQEEREIITGFECSRCKKNINENTDPNGFELQEAHFIHFTGGYSSVFGDMHEIRCELCQDCLFEMIKDYYRVVN